LGGQTVLLEEKDRYLALLGQRFGRRFWEYRQSWAQAEKRAYLGAFPLSLDLAVNGGCQLSCPMCSLPAKDAAYKNLKIPQEIYLKILAEAKESALPALSLGLAREPLVADKIAAKVEAAVKAGVMDIRLGTNGLLLNETLIKGLIDAGLTRLEVSVDAVEPGAYKAIRGGDLATLEKLILLFLDIRAQMKVAWPLLRVSFLRLPQNKGQLGPFLKRWQGLADLVVAQKPIWHPGSKLPKPPLKTVKSIPCGQPWQRLGLGPDGRLWPCCSWYGENLLPRLALKRLSIAKIWRSWELTALRRSLIFNRPTASCLSCAQAGAF
jgi:uncharacterized Fe-S cluster-containing radical SAM superfamily protein